ncbi:MAG TPA: molybdopterin-dependent oxidoreductase, partial [Solirubrobacteraceae bacterium]|nr:molybdopterin-dependent oxidoreductase [Solirubrobacteraceae bacterium]
GAHSYVSTFDGHPYVAPFSGNIIELGPVGALTSRAYRFRARPWDIEDAGSVCALCPAQCNVTFTVREERVERVLARDHPEVDDGWLCDRGRFAHQSIHVPERITEPLVRDGGELRPVSWERALAEAAAGLARAKGAVGAIVGGETTGEEGFLLQRLMREGLASEHIDTIAGIPPTAIHRLARPDLQATVPDLEFAHTVLVIGVEPVREMPILDLRIRKGVRRNGVKLAVATPGPSALDANAALSLRYAPDRDGELVQALALALYGGDGDLEAAAGAAGADAGEIRALADLLSTSLAGQDTVSEPQDIVILYGQRLLAHGEDSVAALERLASGWNLSGREGAGLLAVPAAGTNGRGLIEAGVAPGYGPGYRPREEAGSSTDRIGALLAEGKLGALYLLHADPLRSGLHRETWEPALEKAPNVIAHSSFLTEGLREHARVVFPAESPAEKEGTLVHPDGRLQRLRPAIARPAGVRSECGLIAELAARCGLDLGIAAPALAESILDLPAGLAGAKAREQLYAAVPFYAGLTPEEIGGRGVRWQEREAAAAFPQPLERA